MGHDLRALPAAAQFFVAEQGVETKFGRALAHLLAQRQHLGHIATAGIEQGAFAAQQVLVALLQRQHFALHEAQHRLGNRYGIGIDGEVHAGNLGATTAGTSAA